MTKLSFDPNRTTTETRDAATVIVLDEVGGELRVLCVERHKQSAFMGGAVVFPGGKVDPSDAGDAWTELTTQPHPRASVFAEGDGRGLAIAACRELLEEAAILPTEARLTNDAAVALQGRLGRDEAFLDVLAGLGQRLDLGALVPFARWVTPKAEQRRFDARFFLLGLPAGQRGAHDGHETTHSFWSTPSAVLDRFLAGEVWLAPPTTRTFELLATVNSLDEAMSLAAEQSLEAICPEFLLENDTPTLVLPGDDKHSVREHRVAGTTRFVLREGRFVSEDAPHGPALGDASPKDV